MMKVFKEWGARFEVPDGELKQWDTGRKVQVTLQNGYTLQELGIQHRRAGSAVMIQPSAEGVANIPNSVLTQDGIINIYATLTTPDGRRITRSANFSIRSSIRPDDYAGEGGGSGGGDFILELSEDGKTVLTPIAEYCAAFREGKTVKLNGCYSSWGTKYNLVMQMYSGNPGFEQEAMFSSVCFYANSVSLFNAEVMPSGAITCSNKTLALAT